MENYCRGVLFGMLAGVCVGAIVVAKNKKLSKKINEGFDLAVEKVEDIKDCTLILLGDIGIWRYRDYKHYISLDKIKRQSRA